jgi:hypothetical protein
LRTPASNVFATNTCGILRFAQDDKRAEREHV